MNFSNKIKNLIVSSNDKHKNNLLLAEREFLFHHQPPHFIKLNFHEKIKLEKIFIEFQCGFQPKKISFSYEEEKIEKFLKSTTEEVEIKINRWIDFLYINMGESYDPYHRIHIESFILK